MQRWTIRAEWLCVRLLILLASSKWPGHSGSSLTPTHLTNCIAGDPGNWATGGLELGTGKCGTCCRIGYGNKQYTQCALRLSNAFAVGPRINFYFPSIRECVCPLSCGAVFAARNQQTNAWQGPLCTPSDPFPVPEPTLRQHFLLCYWFLFPFRCLVHCFVCFVCHTVTCYLLSAAHKARVLLLSPCLMHLHPSPFPQPLRAASDKY